MSLWPNAIWLNVSPALQHFDRPLLRYFSGRAAIRQWQYRQDPDAASSLDAAIALLHDFLKAAPHPVHLVGHGTSGLLGWCYAREHPERVRSLTLLGVGAEPAVNWQAHYYAYYRQVPCSRQMALTQMARALVGNRSRRELAGLVQCLQRDAIASPSPHSLLQRASLPRGGVAVPLLACGSQDDAIADPSALQRWQPWLKPGDRLWQCPGGAHLFHYAYPQRVGARILEFWRAQANAASPPAASPANATMAAQERG